MAADFCADLVALALALAGLALALVFASVDLVAVLVARLGTLAVLVTREVLASFAVDLARGVVVFTTLDLAVDERVADLLLAIPPVRPDVILLDDLAVADLPLADLTGVRLT